MPRSSKQTNIGDYYTGSKSPDKGKKRRDKEPKTPIKPQKSKLVTVIEIEDSDEEDGLKNIRLQPSSPPLTSPTLIPEEQTSEEEPPVEQTPLAKRRRRQDASQVVSDPNTSENDDDVPLNILNSKRKRMLSEDSEGRQPKKKRILKRGLRPNKEEKEVLDDLDENVILEPRLRSLDKRSEFSKNLERRRRKPPNEEDSDQESTHITDEDSDGQPIRPIPGSHKAGSAADPVQVDSGSEEDDFIVKDDEEEEIISLPMEYSMNRAQPVEISFKVVVQLFVHVACQSHHLRATYMEARLKGTYDYFRNGLDHVRRHIGGIRDSQVASTVWSSSFRKAFETYPNLETVTIHEEDYKCIACRKSNFRTTREARLSGLPYAQLGFEVRDDSSSSEGEESRETGSDNSTDEEDQSEPSTTSEDSQKPAEKKITVRFKLGQNCSQRVSLFHRFVHWELELFREVEDKITLLETENREKLESKKKKRRKRIIDTTDPDNIIEWMEKNGFINSQWQEIKRMIEGAKHLDMIRVR
ncbi:hypothetical protein CPB86DRAFT_706347 [Serendipita vermifera]|nr:hypothetical protein CPB86DRAFT_706347 [Serendipita vermifera]